MKTLGYYNGEYGPLEQMRVPMNDRVCFFGDGVYEATNGVGYVFMLTADGYGGRDTLSITCGIDSEGKITDTQVLSHSETVGLGSKITGDDFRGQFTGKDSNLEGVDIIGGATFSSNYFIGAIRDVTQQVKERHRREEAAKLLDRMTDNTIAGLEISLEEDSLRLLWGEPVYQHLFGQVVGEKGYTAIVGEHILPTIHPQDREKYRDGMARTALLTALLSGSQPEAMEYRVKTDQAPGYQWHGAEFFCFWDPVSRRAMCNVFVRQVTQEKMRHYQRHHCGHGIGIEVYDPPSVAPGDKTVLQEGMTLNVETPYYEIGWGGVQVEDTVAVEKDSARYLTKSSRKLIKLSL